MIIKDVNEEEMLEYLDKLYKDFRIRVYTMSTNLEVKFDVDNFTARKVLRKWIKLKQEELGQKNITRLGRSKIYKK